MAFHVGQKVVCIDDQPEPVGAILNGFRIAGTGMDGLTEGETYTVAGFDALATNAIGIEILVLAEIVRPNRGLYLHVEGFRSTRFRPLVKSEYDLTVFNEMLSPSQIEKAKRGLVTA